MSTYCIRKHCKRRTINVRQNRKAHSREFFLSLTMDKTADVFLETEHLCSSNFQGPGTSWIRSIVFVLGCIQRIFIPWSRLSLLTEYHLVPLFWMRYRLIPILLKYGKRSYELYWRKSDEDAMKLNFSLTSNNKLMC